jgi:hypothetical protein
MSKKSSSSTSSAASFPKKIKAPILKMDKPKIANDSFQKMVSVAKQEEEPTLKRKSEHLVESSRGEIVYGTNSPTLSEQEIAEITRAGFDLTLFPIRIGTTKVGVHAGKKSVFYEDRGWICHIPNPQPLKKWQLDKLIAGENSPSKKAKIENADLDQLKAQIVDLGERMDKKLDQQMVELRRIASLIVGDIPGEEEEIFDTQSF